MKTEECTAVSTYKKGFCGHSQARRLWRALFRLADARLRLHMRNSRCLSDVWQYVTKIGRPWAHLIYTTSATTLGPKFLACLHFLVCDSFLT